MNSLKKLIKKIFRWEAKLILRKYKPRIIAITGSVGKTSTREALYSVMSGRFHVRKSEKSFTAELGVPLAIIGCSNDSGNIFDWFFHLLYGLKVIFWKNQYPDWLILEIDGDKPGDLYSVSGLLTPDILVMTAIGNVPAHVELFASVEELLLEKKNLVDSVTRTGVVIYNADDENTSRLALSSVARKVSCGVGHGADINASDFNILYGNSKTEQIPTGMSFEVSFSKTCHTINIFQSIGIHNVYVCLLAFAVGRVLEIPTEEIVASLNKYKGQAGRMNIISGIKNTIILDDSYNSSPIALHQALDTLKQIKSSNKKILVVGDMLELGKYSAEEHRKSAHIIKDVADFVICVGLRARLIADELLSLGFPESKILQFDTAEEAALELQKIIEEGNLVLVKGSQAVRLEKIVLEIMRHPQDKEKLLVRQEPEWAER